MLQRQVERIRRSRLVDDIVIATTVETQDDPIADLAENLGVEVFRGSEDDVLGRMAGVMRQFQLQTHVELISDSPFTDPQIIDEIVGFYLKHIDNYDYVSNGTKVTYPSGLEVNVYSAAILLEVNSQVPESDPLREHVDIHLNRNDNYRRICLEAPAHFRRPDIYLEVDTDKDFQMVSSVFMHFDAVGKDHFSLSQILDFLESRPDLVALNQNEERTWREFKN